MKGEESRQANLVLVVTVHNARVSVMSRRADTNAADPPYG